MPISLERMKQIERAAAHADPVRPGYGQVFQEWLKGRPAFTATAPRSEIQWRTG
jgi:hypothetical protein